MRRDGATHARSLLLTGPLRLEWVDEELPEPGPGQALIATTAGAVSVGTELPEYLGTARHSAPPRYPRMTGYESVGVVVAVGAGVTRPRVGERVFGFYGHRTRALVAAEKAIPIPSAVSDRLTLLAILSCDVAKGVRTLRPWIAESALVTGAGTIGLLAVWTLRALGVMRIDVVEPIQARRTLARRLGARDTFVPDASGMRGANADGYDLGIECSSRADAFALLQERMRHGGRICVLAGGTIEPLAPAFHERELLVVGSSDGWDYPTHAAWFFAAARDTAADLERIFDHETTPADLPATFARMADGALAPIKVFVRYPAPTAG
ncbi:MAG TPA: zinc-binding alcohol dehydrogenase [Ktedonobacterales bacterium]|nr:zinc-binding alcohol dehydrogenase [Ktedonobacterales bacterium]